MAQAATTGLFQWLKFGTASANTGTGILTGGTLSHDAQVRRRIGVGGNERRRGGMVAPGGSATFYITDTNLALINAALRATYPRGALTELEIEGGADTWARAYSDAVITTASIEYAREEGVRATVNWGSLGVDTGTGSSQPAEANDIWEDYDCIITGGTYMAAGEYGVNGLTINIDNQVSFHSNANTRAAGSLRLPMFYVHGTEVLTVNLTCDEPILDTTLDQWADCMPDNLDLVLTGENCDGKVLTIDLSSLMPSTDEHGFVGTETLAGWTYDFIGAASGSLAVLTIT